MTSFRPVDCELKSMMPMFGILDDTDKEVPVPATSKEVQYGYGYDMRTIHGVLGAPEAGKFTHAGCLSTFVCACLPH